MTSFYIVSYGHRWSDPLGSIIATSAFDAADACERAMQNEADELEWYCEGHDDDDDQDMCSYCNSDLVSYGPTYTRTPVRDGFVTFAELLQAWRCLRQYPAYYVPHN